MKKFLIITGAAIILFGCNNPEEGKPTPVDSIAPKEDTIYLPPTDQRARGYGDTIYLSTWMGDSSNYFRGFKRITSDGPEWLFHEYDGLVRFKAYKNGKMTTNWNVDSLSDALMNFGRKIK